MTNNQHSNIIFYPLRPQLTNTNTPQPCLILNMPLKAPTPVPPLAFPWKLVKLRREGKFDFHGSAKNILKDWNESSINDGCCRNV